MYHLGKKEAYCGLETCQTSGFCRDRVVSGSTVAMRLANPSRSLLCWVGDRVHSLRATIRTTSRRSLNRSSAGRGLVQPVPVTWCRVSF